MVAGSGALWAAFVRAFSGEGPLTWPRWRGLDAGLEPPLPAAGLSALTCVLPSAPSLGISKPDAVGQLVSEGGR